MLKMTEDKFLEHLGLHIYKEYKTATVAAKNWHLSGSHLSLICKGKRPPTEVILNELGFIRDKAPAVISYRRKTK